MSCLYTFCFYGWAVVETTKTVWLLPAFDFLHTELHGYILGIPTSKPTPSPAFRSSPRNSHMGRDDAVKSHAQWLLTHSSLLPALEILAQILYTLSGKILTDRCGQLQRTTHSMNDQ